MTPEQKKNWTFIDGHLLCTNCVLAVERGEQVYGSKRELLASGRGIPLDKRLRKLESGKVWDGEGSFTKPYEQSPEVTQKLSRLQAGADVVLQLKA